MNNIGSKLGEIFEQFCDNKNLKYFCSFVDEKLRVKFTRIFKNCGEFRVSIGKPNYSEKKYIQKSKKMKVKINGLILTKDFKVKK